MGDTELWYEKLATGFAFIPVVLVLFMLFFGLVYFVMS